MLLDTSLAVITITCTFESGEINNVLDIRQNRIRNSDSGQRPVKMIALPKFW